MKRHYIKVILLSFLLSSCNLEELYSDFNKYEEYIDKTQYSEKFMPKKNQINEYSSVSVYYLYIKLISNSINLVISYDSEKYQRAKEQLFNTYQIIEETKEKYSDVGNRMLYNISPIVFNYKQFKINVVEDTSFDYSRHFGMIGCSDETNSICYMYWSIYDSIDLELTNDQQMCNFINNYYYFE